MKFTLCGSTKFREQFEHWNRVLSKRGHLVYSVSSYGHSGDSLTESEKEALDLVHLQKIVESDAILVVGLQDDGMLYIGDSTRREIKWASMLGKRIYGLKSHDDYATLDTRSQQVLDAGAIARRLLAKAANR